MTILGPLLSLDRKEPLFIGPKIPVALLSFLALSLLLVWLLSGHKIKVTSSTIDRGLHKRNRELNTTSKNKQTMIASALSAYEEQQQQQLPSNELLEGCYPMVSRRKERSSAVKTVSFSATAKVRSTIHLGEYTDLERFNTWYNRAELKSIHTENRCIIDLVLMGEIVEDDYERQISARGLESFTSSEIRSKKQYDRAVALDAVLNEQYYQQSNNMTADAEQIAMEYSQVTYECQVAANMIGISDEIAANNTTGRRTAARASSNKKQRPSMSARLHQNQHVHVPPAPSRVAIFGSIPYPRSL